MIFHISRIVIENPKLTNEMSKQFRNQIEQSEQNQYYCKLVIILDDQLAKQFNISKMISENDPKLLLIVHEKDKLNQRHDELNHGQEN
jgi:hypothetical protein